MGTHRPEHNLNIFIHRTYLGTVDTYKLCTQSSCRQHITNISPRALSPSVYRARSPSKDTSLAMPATHPPLASYRYLHLSGLKAYRHLELDCTRQHQVAM